MAVNKINTRIVNFDDVAKRVSEYGNASRDKGVAAVLGISPQDYNNRKRRGTLLFVVFDWATRNQIDLNWMFYGESKSEKTGGKL